MGRDVLDHIPVFHDLTLLQSEDIDNRAPRGAIAPGGMNVQGDQIAFRDDLGDLAVLMRILGLQKIYESLQPLRTVFRRRVMLAALAKTGSSSPNRLMARAGCKKMPLVSLIGTPG